VRLRNMFFSHSLTLRKKTKLELVLSMRVSSTELQPKEWKC
jgi:hypothetical protein